MYLFRCIRRRSELYVRIRFVNHSQEERGGKGGESESGRKKKNLNTATTRIISYRGSRLVIFHINHRNARIY